MYTVPNLRSCNYHI